jgi:hypothetical protein
MQYEEIDRIVREIAKANLSSSNISTVQSSSMIDSEGQEALRIQIVLTPGSTDRIRGEDTLNTLYEVRYRLQEAGEDRFPIIEYATKEELAEIGDT